MTTSEFDTYLTKNYPRTSSFLSGLSLFFVDALVLIMCIGISFFIVNCFNPSAINFKSFIYYSIYIPFILLLFACIGLYPGIMNSPTEEVKRFFFTSLFSFISIILTIILSRKEGFDLTKKIVQDSGTIGLIIAFSLSIPIATIALPGFREFAKHSFSHFKWWGVPAVMYTDGDSANFIIEKLLRHKYLGYYPAVIINSGVKNHDTCISTIRRNSFNH